MIDSVGVNRRMFDEGRALDDQNLDLRLLITELGTELQHALQHDCAGVGVWSEALLKQTSPMRNARTLGIVEGQLSETWAYFSQCSCLLSKYCF